MTNLSQTEGLNPRRIMARTLPKPQTISQKTGIRYENALFKRLQFLANTIDGEVEHNPWFEYYDDENELRCAVPDFIFAKGSFTLVIECKLTFVPEAVTKLRELYVPLVEKISRRVPRTIVKPLVVCKTMSPLAEALPYVYKFSEIFSRDLTNTPVYQWLGHTGLQW